jgi:hypothetical protein
VPVTIMSQRLRTFRELQERFTTEDACRRYLFRLRWPDGFVCPRCGATEAWPMVRGRSLCGSCRYQASVTAGTIFQDSHLPLMTWLRAIWHITVQRGPVTPVELHRALGLRSSRTAWALLQKLRPSMVRPGRDRLRGTVEVDQTSWSTLGIAPAGRGSAVTGLLIVAAESQGAGSGRIFLRLLPDLARPAVHQFIADAVDPGSILRTGATVSQELTGYLPERPGQRPEGEHGLPCIQCALSHLKRWLSAAQPAQRRQEHLVYYLDEFSFRFNHRKSASPGKLFHRLAQQAVQVGPATLGSPSPSPRRRM